MPHDDKAQTLCHRVVFDRVMAERATGEEDVGWVVLIVGALLASIAFGNANM
jgi:hypothetical protein